MKGKLSIIGVLAALVAGVVLLTTETETPVVVYDLNNPQEPVLGVLTGGQPSQDDLIKLHQEGYGTVINLRLPGEFDDYDEADLVESLGMTYISLPIDVREGLTKANAAQLDQLVADAEGPALVHCGSGDRVGALYAINAFHQAGLSVEESIAAGKSAGLNRLEGAVRTALSGEE